MPSQDPHEFEISKDRSRLETMSERLQMEQYEEKRTHETERRRIAAEGMREILRILNTNSTLDEILQLIIAQACHLFETESGAIYRLDRENQVLTIQASQGIQQDTAQAPIAIGQGIVGMAALIRTPLLVTNLTTLQTENEIDADLIRKEVKARFGESVNALFAVPVLVNGEVYGDLVLYYTKPRKFLIEDIQLALSIADQAALAIENARLHEQARQLAAIEERHRLSRELHDSVSQTFYAIALTVRKALHQLPDHPRKALEPLGYALSLAETGMAEMRAVLFELRPESLEIEGLVAGLAKQAALLGVSQEIQVVTQFPEEPKLSLNSREALYRIAQEALANIVKHAHASRVNIQMVSQDPWVILEIADDGLGFDTDQYHPGHLGLLNMQERAEQFGGSFEIHSTPSVGTTIRVQIPQEEG